MSSALGRVRTSLGRRFPLRHLRKDAPAGLVLGVESVPDGLAGGLLAGVNPVYGLYAYMFGTLFGAVATSSAFMTVQATGAMAVVVSDVPQVHGGTPEADTALFTLSVLTGAVMLVLGLARLGGLVRWVPNAVLTGFINAVAVNIVLGQLDDFTGYDSVGDNRIASAVNSLVHLGSWAWSAVLIGAATIVLILILERTPLGALGLVVAIVLTSAAVSLLSLDVVQLRSITEIPGSLPSPSLPSLSLVAGLAIPAVSLAFVGLVQGAAISSSVPNPDGTYPNASGDFVGQGVANIGSGLLQGMPVGGSMSATSIVTNAGARSRLALLVAGATMIVAVLLLSDLVGLIAMPALAGLLMVVGVRTLRVDALVMVWHTGAVQAAVLATTFVLTLLIPLQYAVLVGVGMSVVLHVARQSNRVTVREWVVDEAGITEVEPRPQVGVGEVVVLRPYGSLFFAAAPTFERALPAITGDTRASAVVISLRGKEDLGSTFINVVTRYAEALDAHGSGLWISGVSERTLGQLAKTGTIALIGEDRVHLRTPVIAESTREAVQEARAWVAVQTDEPTT
jgi:SulP family sulfate permease